MTILRTPSTNWADSQDRTQKNSHMILIYSSENVAVTPKWDDACHHAQMIKETFLVGVDIKLLVMTPLVNPKINTEEGNPRPTEHLEKPITYDNKAP